MPRCHGLRAWLAWLRGVRSEARRQQAAARRIAVWTPTTITLPLPARREVAVVADWLRCQLPEMWNDVPFAETDTFAAQLLDLQRGVEQGRWKRCGLEAGRWTR
jgi:hypothetical protein